MAIPKLNFSTGNVVDPTRGAMQGLESARGVLTDMIKQGLAEEDAARKEALVRDQMSAEAEYKKAQLTQADKTYQLQATKDDRDIAGQRALIDYTNKLENYSTDVLTPAQGEQLNAAYNKGATPEALQAKYDTMSKGYNADPVARLATLKSVASLPTGEYDPTKLYAVREAAMARPEKEIDDKQKLEAAALKRIQDMQDKYKLAEYKESIKGGKEPTSSAYYVDGKLNMLTPVEVNKATREGRLVVDPATYRTGLDKDGKGSGTAQKPTSGLTSGDPTLVEELTNLGSTWARGSSTDNQRVDTLIKFNDNIASLLNIPAKEAVGYTKRVTDKGGFGSSVIGGAEEINPDRINEVFKGQTVNVKAYDGTYVEKPLGLTLQAIAYKDESGQSPYYIKHVKGKAILEVNPAFNMPKIGKEAVTEVTPENIVKAQKLPKTIAKDYTRNVYGEIVPETAIDLEDINKRLMNALTPAQKSTGAYYDYKGELIR